MIMDKIQIKFIEKGLKEICLDIDRFLSRYPRYFLGVDLFKKIQKKDRKLLAYLDVLKKEPLIDDGDYDCICGKDCPHYTVHLNSKGEKVEGCRKALGL